MNFKELRERIAQAKIDYYQSGRSELTDAEYDRLVEQAERLGYVETVGAAPVDNIEKITHEHPMLSLDKCHTIQEIKDFIGDKDVIAMDKADGLSLSATYIDGVLTRLETRGDGKIGNDIMFHAKSIENLPLRINKPGKYVIDGECVILRKDFDEINSKMAVSERYSNTRNLAAGTLNLLDSSVSKKRHLRFYAWDVIEGGGNSLIGNLAEAHTLGFNTVSFMSVKDSDTLTEDLNMFKSRSEEYGFPIDGVVFKYNDIAYGKSLGMTGHHPKNAIAFKFKDDTYETRLLNIEWQVGKTGQITPVAIFDSVYIDNVEINKASLSNISIMKKTLGSKPYFGQKIWIGRMNMVIPKIVKSIDYNGKEICI